MKQTQIWLFSWLWTSLSSATWIHLAPQLARLPRQVVQPTWLQQPTLNMFGFEVRVTPENLREAAAIRADIQQAVDNGSYFVLSAGPTAQQLEAAQAQSLAQSRPLPIPAFAPIAWPALPNWANFFQPLGQQQQRLKFA